MDNLQASEEECNKTQEETVADGDRCEAPAAGDSATVQHAAQLEQPESQASDHSAPNERSHTAVHSEAAGDAQLHSSQQEVGSAQTGMEVSGQEVETSGTDTGADVPGSGVGEQATEAESAAAAAQQQAEEPTKPAVPEFRFPSKPKFKSVEAALARMKEYFEYLAEQTEYDTPDCLHLLKGLNRMYWDLKSHRSTLSHSLVQLNFHEHVKKMTVYFNRVGIFKSDSVWFPCYYCMNSVWNFSDSSKEIAKAITDVGMIHYYVLNITHQPYLDNRSSKNVAYVLKASLSILQNIIRQNPDCKPMFDGEKVVSAMEPFLRDDDEMMKCLAIFTISAAISEDEAAKLEDTGSIAFVVRGIGRSLRSEKRRFRGFTPLELTEGLARLAANDANKRKIVEAGALPLLVQLMQAKDVDEQLQAAKTIWTLCFDDYSRQKVVEEEGCVHTLEGLAAGEQAQVRRQASGALWKLRGEAQHKRQKTTVLDDASDKHIFISYNWDHKDTVHKIKDRLKSEGCKVWIDVEQMGGSTLEAMALAVENAYVVLVCASEKYKLSPNCRTEAEYTFQLKRPIVPLMMQRHYKPDGWLGMLMGAKLYVNFDGKYDFHHAYELLLKEMAAFTARDQCDYAEERMPVVKAAVVSEVMSSAPPPRSPPNLRREAATWTRQQVTQWLQDSHLHTTLNEELRALLSSMDGPLLITFCNMKHTAASFFYEGLTQQCGATMLQLVALSAALDALP